MLAVCPYPAPCNGEASGAVYLLSRLVRNSQIHSPQALVPAHTYPGSLDPAFEATRSVRGYCWYVVVLV